MRLLPLRSLLLVGICFVTALSAQQPSQQTRASAAVLRYGAPDLAITYNTLRGSTTSGQSFWLQGASVQLHDRFYKGLGAVADLSIARTGNMAGTGVGLRLITATFGPRYTIALPKPTRTEIYAQALGGFTHASNGLFPGSGSVSSTASSAALNLGGGLNLRLMHKLSLRPIELAWARSTLANNSANQQDNLRIGSGMVIHF